MVQLFKFIVVGLICLVSAVQAFDEVPAVALSAGSADGSKHHDDASSHASGSAAHSSGSGSNDSIIPDNSKVPSPTESHKSQSNCLVGGSTTVAAVVTIIYAAM